MAAKGACSMSTTHDAVPAYWTIPADSGFKSDGGPPAGGAAIENWLTAGNRDSLA